MADEFDSLSDDELIDLAQSEGVFDSLSDDQLLKLADAHGIKTLVPEVPDAPPPPPAASMPWYEQLGRGVADTGAETLALAGKLSKGLFNPGQFAIDQINSGPSAETVAAQWIKSQIGNAPDTLMGDIGKWGAAALVPGGSWPQRLLSSLGGFIGERSGIPGADFLGSLVGGGVATKAEKAAPITQRAISLMERLGATGGAKGKVEAAQMLTAPRANNAKIAGEFGAGVGRTAFDQSLADLSDEIPVLSEMGVLNGGSVEDIASNVATATKEVGTALNEAKTAISSAYGKVGRTRGADHPASIKISDLAEPIADLEAKASQLMLSESTKEAGQAILNEISKLKQVDFLGGRSPAEAAEILQNWNLFRRTLGAFDPATKMAMAQGSVGKLAGIDEASGVLAKLSQTLKEKIVEKIKILNAQGGSQIDPNVFVVNNEKFGALKTLARTIEAKTLPQIQEGFARPGARRMIQGTGEASPLVNPSDLTARGLTGKALSKVARLFGAESNIDQFKKAYGASGDIAQNVQDLLAIRGRALPPPPSSSVTQRLGGGAIQTLRNLPAVNGPGDANAMEPTPQLPSLDPQTDLKQRAMQYMQNGLPRDTQSFMQDNVALGAFVDKIKGTPKEGIGIQLGKKLADAVKAKDSQKTRRIIADMAKLFPEVFEEGLGVDNKLFHPDDQRDYINMLWSAQRKGVVKANFIAKQRDAFLDPNDSKIIPFEPSEKHIVDLQHYAKPTQKRPVVMSDKIIPREYDY